jgi:AGCS family alanine or glycine:cation symporter|tara:strand:+ start:21294 stop:22685 length:1392 start_codon:yes stop_codon:yes gene_type:complete
LSWIEQLLIDFGNYAWGPWLLVLILGGGGFLILFSRLLPFRYLGHALHLIRGRFDESDSPGQISHFQALCSALAGTIGMGNIAGVAIAIHVGGPGAIFWMWATAVVGIATKFFTCTLAVMYRGKDSLGVLQGGPMYVVMEGLGPRWKPLAILFSLAGLIGCIPAFQTNQLVQTLREVIFLRNEWIDPSQTFQFNLIAGVLLAIVVALVIFGGLHRIAAVSSRLVPTMTILYLLSAAYIVLSNFSVVPHYLALIFSDAFSGDAAAGGVIGTVIATGVRRGAFSNEAGIGTEALAHGAARTSEPVREGLVAMLGPVIDTLVVCTATALVILMSGEWLTESAEAVNGVTLTARAFDAGMPGIGIYVLIICVFFFSSSTIFSYSYYGTKCLGFLVGAEYQHLYNYAIVLFVLAASVLSLDAIVGLVDGAFALMAIPTMTSTLLLSPKVMSAARVYFSELNQRHSVTL